jgi:dihydrofolate reductase
MGNVRFGLAMSLDGYVAGPEQSLENPLGVGGMQLHEWAFRLDAFKRAHGEEGGETSPSSAVVEESVANVGAYVMGRNMFGGGPGPWREDWQGWWGDDPPYHTPVFVVTHHAREPLIMQGGTTFNFVTDGLESALAQARDAAGGKDVVIAGGASVVQQSLVAGYVDEVNVSLVPLLLGAGERLFDNLGAAVPRLEQVRVVEAPDVTHIKYRVVAASR